MSFSKFISSILFFMISELTFAKSSLVEAPISTGWKMRETTAIDWLSAIVPGCVHSDLLLNKQILEPYFRTNEKQLQWIDKKDWEYKTSFDVTKEVFSNEHIELVFRGLDTYATVYFVQLSVNGQSEIKKVIIR